MIQSHQTSVESPVCIVAVSEYGELHAMLGLAREIEAKLGLHPLFVFASGYGKVSEHGQLVELQGHSWLELGSVHRSFTTLQDISSQQGYFQILPGGKNIIFSSPVAADEKKLPTSSRLRIELDHLLSRIKRRFFSRDNDGAASHTNLKRQMKAAHVIFDRLDVRLIVSGQDYALSATSILAWAGARKNVRLAIVPYSMPPTTREIVESFARLKINRVPRSREPFFKQHFEPWLMSYRGVTYSRLHARDMISANRFGLTPPLPWTPNSGLGKLLLPSTQAMDYYQQSGIAPKQMVITGAPWNDELLALEPSRAERKQRLLSRIRSELRASGQQVIDTERLVIVSWPPNQWPRKAMGCESYSDLCQQLVAALAAIRISGLAHVGVSLHPTLSDPAILNRLRRAGIVVLHDSLIKMIDCADVFSATVSSTAFWAIQCGIPTINFDGYLYGYREFDEAGATTVRTPGQLREGLDRLLSNEAAYADAQSNILAQRDYWTVRSGNSRERIMAELKTLMLNSTEPDISRKESSV